MIAPFLHPLNSHLAICCRLRVFWGHPMQGRQHLHAVKGVPYTSESAGAEPLEF